MSTTKIPEVFAFEFDAALDLADLWNFSSKSMNMEHFKANQEELSSS